MASERRVIVPFGVGRCSRTARVLEVVGCLASYTKRQHSRLVAAFGTFEIVEDPLDLMPDDYVVWNVCESRPCPGRERDSW